MLFRSLDEGPSGLKKTTELIGAVIKAAPHQKGGEKFQVFVLRVIQVMAPYLTLHSFYQSHK